MEENISITGKTDVSGNNGNEINNQFNIDINSLSLEEPGNQVEQPVVPDQTQDAATQEQFEIDPKFRHLPEKEALLRTFQSRYDKLSSVHSQLAQKVQELEKLENLFELMTKDENLLRTFVNQVKPGIIPQKDFAEVIRETIKKEFGEDYKPTMTRLEAERDDPGGLDWKYYKRLDQLEREFSQGNSEYANSIAEYLEKRQKMQEAEQQKMKQEIETVKKELSVSDEEIKGTLSWYENLKLKDLIVLNRFLRKFPTTKAGNIVTSPGSGQTSSRQQFLNTIFNKR